MSDFFKGIGQLISFIVERIRERKAEKKAEKQKEKTQNLGTGFKYKEGKQRIAK